MKDLYLLDASGFIYRSYFAIQGLSNLQGEATGALYGFIRSYFKLIQEFHPAHLVAVFDGENNKQARKELYEDYKAHRKPIPEDLIPQMLEAKRFCTLMNIPLLAIPGVEADDTIGSIASWASSQGAHAFICTGDKDMAQLVNDKVSLKNPFKEYLLVNKEKVKELYGVWPEQIQDYFALIGDASDNIPGVEGIGPKTASALLQTYGTLQNILEHTQEIGGKKQAMLETQKEIALLSKELVKIKLDVPFPQDPSFFALGAPNHQEAVEFLKQKNFLSIVKFIEGKTAQKSSPSTSEWNCISTEKDLSELLKTLETSSKEICVDTETTDTHPLRAELVGIGLGVHSNKSHYIPLNKDLSKEQILSIVKPFFENKNNKFFGHNVKYDYHILKTCGIDLATISTDTILISYLLHAQQRKHSLDELSLQYFDKTKISIEELIGKGKAQITMDKVPIEKVASYCCEDVEYTIRLKETLEPKIKEKNLLPLLQDIEIPLIKVLARMEQKGIFVDTKVLKKLGEETGKEIYKLQEEIFLMAGEPFNLNSPKQLSEILFQKLALPITKKGRTMPSTSAEVLETLAHQYPIAQKILDYRSLEKLRSTYIETLPEQVFPKTGRIHAQFNQSVAATGRLSCQDPNLQNIPVRSELGKKIRSAFRPERDDWSFLSSDYSQVELRILAHVTEDPGLVQAFHDNADIHAYTASEIFHIPINEVTSDMRRKAKAVNFGIIYGQQPFGLAQELGISVQEAANFITLYFKRYAKVRDCIEYFKEQARTTGKAVTLTGRERLLPDIMSSNTILRTQAERLAVNTPFQGTAADIIKLAMIDIDQWMQDTRCKAAMLLQIHDELLFEVPDTEILSLQEGVKQRMEHVFELKVPLTVEIGIGKNWMEC